MPAESKVKVFICANFKTFITFFPPFFCLTKFREKCVALIRVHNQCFNQLHLVLYKFHAGINFMLYE